MKPNWCAFRRDAGAARAVLVLALSEAHVHGRQHGEHVCLQEGNEAFERVHGDEEHGPCNRGDACGIGERDQIEDEELGHDRKDAKDHVAGEHVAVKSNSKGQQADDQGEELAEPSA